jgi:hypothetical protein
VQLTCLFPASRTRDPKVRLFADFAIARMRAEMGAALAGLALPGQAAPSQLQAVGAERPG